MTAFAQVTTREILKQKTENYLKEIIDSSPSLTGLMAIDLTSGEIIIGINSDIVFTQASAIKIPILMEVYKQAHENKSSATPSDIIAVISKRVFDYFSMLKATKYGVLLEN